MGSVEAKRIEVATVVLLREGRMLVSLRPDGAFYGGWWEWPGGKREPGESFEDCARRELREEIGLAARALSEFDRRVVEYPGRLVTLVTFVGAPDPGSAPHASALEHRWVTLEELAGLRFLEANAPIVARLAQALAAGGLAGLA